MPMNQDKLPLVSLGVSLGDLAEADSRQRADKAPRVETSGLMDLRQLAKIYEKQNQPPGRDGDAIPELITVGIGTPPGLLMPLPPPPELDLRTQQAAQRNRLLYVMSAVAGVLGLGAMALAFVVLRGGLAQTSPAGVPNPAQQPALAQATQPEAQPAATAESPATAAEHASPAGDSASGAGKAENESSKAARNSDHDDAADDASDDRASSRRSRRSRDRRSRDRDRDSQPREAAAPEPREAPAAPPENRCMDERACELAPNPPACCSRYKARNSAGSEPSGAGETRRESVDQDLPRGLERSDIAAGMATVQDSVAACGAGHLAKGTVTVSVKVGGEGKVARVRVTSSPHQELGSCVAGKVRGASFARTQKGATFSYPFVFK
jgi:hypothetical protein